MTSPPLCPLTHQPMELALVLPTDWRRPQPPHTQRVYWCASSAYGTLHPRPTAAEIEDAYRIENYYTRGEAAERLAGAPVQKDFFTRLRIGLSWRRDAGTYIDQAWIRRHFGAGQRQVLDIGCGNGHVMAEFKRAGHDVLGVEPDAAARDTARARGLDVLDGTAEALPAEVMARQFDVIIMTHVLEHTLDPVLAVQSAAARLSDGGQLVLETPNNAALGRELAASTWRWLDVPRHLNFFTPQSLQLICQRTGLEATAVEFRGYTRQFLPEWIRDEQEIWDVFQHANGEWQPIPPRSSVLRSWLLLFRTLFAPGDKKYDSVRVLAQRQT